MSGKTTLELGFQKALVAWTLASILTGTVVWAGTDWPSGRHDAQNTASTRLRPDTKLSPRSWTLALKRHVWGYQPGMAVWSSPAVGLVGGRAVIAVGAYDRNVYLLDACTGSVIWKFTTGGGVYQAPVIWQDQNQAWIFAASSDRLVYALDAGLGRRIWSTPVQEYRPTLGGARLSSPSVGKVQGKDAVFVGHWVFDKSLKNNLQQGGVSALEASSGKPLWRVEFLDNRVSAPVYAEISDLGMLFVSSEDGNLRALEANTGRLLWHHRETEPIMGSVAWFQTPRGPLLIMGSHFGKVRCLDARTGKEIWSFKTGNWITGSPAVYRVNGRLLVAVGSYDQRIYGLDALTGEKVWSLPTAGPVYSSVAVVEEAEPVVMASSWDHHLYGVSGRDGSLLWTVYTGPPIWDAVTLGDSPWSSPAAAWISDRWMVYHGSYSGVFYGIPLNQAYQAGSSQAWSNRRFWITMLLSLALTAILSLYLSKRGVRTQGLSPRVHPRDRPD